MSYKNIIKIAVGIIIGLTLGWVMPAFASTVWHDPTFIDGKPINPSNELNNIYRYDDPKYQVKCWVFYPNSDGGSISCLPWNDIKQR
jgi:hypothetical protein